MLRRSTSLALIVTWLVFSLQGCMTLIGRKAQHVTVTARPAGARVLVDGEFEGITPLALRLAKKPPHVIRIEKEGYRPVEIRLKRKKLWFPILLGNLIWMPSVAIWGFNPDAQTDYQVFAKTFFPLLSLAVYAGAVFLDANSPKGTVLDPMPPFNRSRMGLGRRASVRDRNGPGRFPERHVDQRLGHGSRRR